MHARILQFPSVIERREAQHDAQTASWSDERLTGWRWAVSVGSMLIGSWVLAFYAAKALMLAGDAVVRWLS